MECDLDDLPEVMEGRKRWWERVRDSSTDGMASWWCGLLEWKNPLYFFYFRVYSFEQMGIPKNVQLYDNIFIYKRKQ